MLLTQYLSNACIWIVYNSIYVHVYIWNVYYFRIYCIHIYIHKQRFLAPTSGGVCKESYLRHSSQKIQSSWQNKRIWLRAVEGNSWTERPYPFFSSLAWTPLTDEIAMAGHSLLLFAVRRQLEVSKLSRFPLDPSNGVHCFHRPVLHRKLLKLSHFESVTTVSSFAELYHCHQITRKTYHFIVCGTHRCEDAKNHRSLAKIFSRRLPGQPLDVGSVKDENDEWNVEFGFGSSKGTYYIQSSTYWRELFCVGYHDCMEKLATSLIGRSTIDLEHNFQTANAHPHLCAAKNARRKTQSMF